MDINQKMVGIVIDNENPVLHVSYRLDDDFEQIYDELTIPDSVEVFISDISAKKINISSSLRVLDLYPTVKTDLDFNMNNNMKDIIIRDTNIINKSIMQLFPKHCRYRYANCELNNNPIYIELNRLYKKYFNESNKLSINIINYRIHSTIVEKIRNYEECIKQKKEICNTFKEELMMKLYHPDRVFKLIETYGIEVLDEI
jgi:hypothetical protein